LALLLERLWVFARFSMAAKADAGRQGLPQGMALLQQTAAAGSEVVEAQLALWLEQQRLLLQRRCRLLQLLGALAPLLGLLGTVLGIITMFQEVASHSGPVTPALLAEGMWQAMSTTAIGLLIAIPALGLGQGLMLWGQARIETMTASLNSAYYRAGE
ncbi:MAG: MotA/TolQ/ExbB proton channel family protein, partial [Cellvibrionaceae bacterium]|nr:MotA/TolQ/ExbB proton channel family protein [Cellvibrionaceae bacterium]